MNLETTDVRSPSRRFRPYAVRTVLDAAPGRHGPGSAHAPGCWCGAAGVENVVTLSDHKDASFGENYGFLIEELRLLTRGVVVIDKNDKVTYVEYVPEVTHAVNFDATIEAIKAAL